MCEIIGVCKKTTWNYKELIKNSKDLIGAEEKYLNNIKVLIILKSLLFL
jgi:hypothetical protein